MEHNFKINLDKEETIQKFKRTTRPFLIAEMPLAEVLRVCANMHSR